MVHQNKHLFIPVKAADLKIASMVSELDADELNEVGNGSGGDGGILGLGGRLRDGAGLDPQVGSGSREMAGDGRGSQKDRLLEFRLQPLEEKW